MQTIPRAFYVLHTDVGAEGQFRAGLKMGM
jgi:hypothetical protein